MSRVRFSLDHFGFHLQYMLNYGACGLCVYLLWATPDLSRWYRPPNSDCA